MSEKSWEAVDAYINDLLIGRDAALDAALQASSAAGLPTIEVAPNQGKLLMLLARMMGARNILEIGTLGGYSTIWLARALPEDGRLISLEAEPRHAEVARGNLAEAGLADVAEIRVGPALESLPKLADEGIAPFDFVFIDADKPNNPNYFEWAMKLARPGTVIVADNVVRYGAVADATSQDASVRGARSFMEIVAAEPRVTATAVQTVGQKGHDGFAIALVTGD